MIVVDASVIVETLLRRPSADLVNKAIFSSDRSLDAPHLLDVEVTSVLRRFVLAGGLSVADGQAALQNFTSLRISRHGHQRLLPRIWELRANISAYDATYVALAEALDAPLLTRDRRLAASGLHRAQIELIP